MVFLNKVSPVWSMHYRLGLTVSNRTFTELIVTHLEEATPGTPKTGWLVSIPFDTTGNEGLEALETKGVRAKYVSVERLLQLDDGRVEWRCEMIFVICRIAWLMGHSTLEWRLVPLPVVLFLKSLASSPFQVQLPRFAVVFISLHLPIHANHGYFAPGRTTLS